MYRYRLFIVAGLLAVLDGCAAGRLTPGAMPFDADARSRAAAEAVASLQIVLPANSLALGQTSTFSVVARNASGQVITGAYDHPIVLGAGHLLISPASIAGGAQAQGITATWYHGFAGNATDTITAYDDAHFATATLAPATGFAYYDAGDNITYDDVGFEMTLGPGGAVYYGTEGPLVELDPATELYGSADGAIGKFDPTIGSYSQIELNSGVIGLLSSSDGALWMGGSYSHYLFRLPPGQFSQSALIAIPVPPPATVFPYFIRQLTQDASGHIWFDDLRGGRLFKIPLAGPYVAASLTAYGLPKGPPGTPGITPSGQGIAVGNDRLLYVLDYLNGVVDQVSPASGLTERQLVLPQQETFGPNDSAYPRFIAKDGSGKLYFTYIGDTTYKPPVAPGIDELVPPSTAIKSVPIFEPPSGSQPDSIGANGANLYYADLYGALGYIDTATNQTRLFPTFSVAQSLSSDYYETPDGIAAMPDGTAWFTCDNYKVLVPECLGHTVYLTGWSLFPGPTFTLLTGSGNAQGVGIMESPKVNSGPFKAVSDKTAICSIGGLSDHNFYVTGLKPGSCVVTVTDIAHHAATLQIVVQSAPPQVRPRRRRVAF